MLEVACPSCASRVATTVAAGDAVCPSCGHEFSPAHATGGQGSDSAYDGVAARVREAFGADGGLVGSSEVWGRAADQTGPGLTEATRPLAGAGIGPGRQLGDFELLEEIGRGGMGIVFRARQMSLNRIVALKVLPVLMRDSPAVERFLRESQAAARLHHTNIVPVYARGEEDGAFYYAMELVEGAGLDRALKDHRLVGASRTRSDYRRIARLMAEVAEGVDHAHRQGVIHRDIKPQNLLLGSDQRLHITDFGLAFLRDEPHMTRTGERIGTPAYMSPEQCGASPARIDHRTDIYSLGVTLYELLTLRRPFEAEAREQLITRITTCDPTPPRRLDPRVPRDLETICLRAIEKDPPRRYASAEALATDLRRFAEDRPILARRIGRLAKAVKWTRRHKAASAALLAVALALVLGTALVASVTASRRRQAVALLQEAYDQLVFIDLRPHKTALITPKLEQAAKLGANPRRLAVTRALATMLGDDKSLPIAQIQPVLDRDPHDVEALYLLAWAQWRSGEKQASRETLRRADDHGGPRTAAQRFFRGNALIRDDPARAIEAYEAALRQRAGENEAFPQATLYLARAHNQRMYQTRSLETYLQTQDALRHLMQYDQLFDAHPYYLLSIAHRLAGDIHQSLGRAHRGRAEEHYREALRCAVEGQARALPGDPYALMAEAECHESTGDFAAAIAARTRAIDITPHAGHRLSNYYYRWRLYYWSGRLDAALRDLETLRGEFGVNDVFCTKIYPALIHAELGAVDRATALAGGIVDPANATAIAAVQSALLLRLLGRPREALAYLNEHQAALDFSAGLIEPRSEAWLRALYDFASEKMPLEELLERAGDHPELIAEAYFCSATAALSTDDSESAAEHFERAYRSFDSEEGYTYRAKTILVRLSTDPAWPSWKEGGNP